MSLRAFNINRRQEVNVAGNKNDRVLQRRPLRFLVNSKLYLFVNIIFLQKRVLKTEEKISKKWLLEFFFRNLRFFGFRQKRET